MIWAWEMHAAGVDPSIHRLPLPLTRSQPILRRALEGLGVPAWDFWGYLAPAEGPWPERRLVAVFLGNPRTVDPTMLCLDGPTDSKHRNTSIELCLYYTRDPSARRWDPSDGLVRLFDLGRRHLLCEHIWRERGRRDEDWPVEDAPHGYGDPALNDQTLLLPVELAQLSPQPPAPWR